MYRKVLLIRIQETNSKMKQDTAVGPSKSLERIRRSLERSGYKRKYDIKYMLNKYAVRVQIGFNRLSIGPSS
jgi:hypothetical protein